MAHYKVTGTGDDYVVILQGWGTKCVVYDSVAAMLGQTMRVVQLDLPGFGSSDEPEEPWDAQRYAEFVFRFCQAFGIERCMLLAHSFGGRVALKMVTGDETPVKIDGLIMVDSAGIVRQRTAAENRRIVWFKLMKRVCQVPLVKASFPDLIEVWMEKQGSEDYRNSSEVMKRTMVMSISEELSPIMPKVPCRTVLIWGRDDDATPVSDGERMEELIPGAKLRVINDAGHYCFLDQPVAFWDALEPFLDEAEEVRGANGKAA